jgi:hypothetical protein
MQLRRICTSTLLWCVCWYLLVRQHCSASWRVACECCVSVASQASTSKSTTRNVAQQSYDAVFIYLSARGDATMRRPHAPPCLLLRHIKSNAQRSSASSASHMAAAGSTLVCTSSPCSPLLPLRQLRWVTRTAGLCKVCSLEWPSVLLCKIPVLSVVMTMDLTCE